MEDKFFIKTLPLYLQNDINNLVNELKKEKSTIIDCLMDEVYGSINSAYYDNEITKEEADYLRSKYYFGNSEDDLNEED